MEIYKAESKKYNLEFRVNDTVVLTRVLDKNNHLITSERSEHQSPRKATKLVEFICREITPEMLIDIK